MKRVMSSSSSNVTHLSTHKRVLIFPFLESSFAAYEHPKLDDDEVLRLEEGKSERDRFSGAGAHTDVMQKGIDACTYIS